MKTKKIVAIMIVITYGLIFGPLPVEATLVTIAIEAEVVGIGDPHGYLEGKISVGDIISGTYTYDTLTPDSNPSLSVGDYEHYYTPYGIFLTVGGFEFRTDPSNVNFLVEIGNDHPWFEPDVNRDHYLVRSYNNLPLSNGARVDQICWQLNDDNGIAISSTDLPTTAPVLDDWQSNILSLGSLRSWGISARVTSAVPEPGTVLLFGLGVMLLIKQK